MNISFSLFLSHSKNRSSTELHQSFSHTPAHRRLTTTGAPKYAGPPPPEPPPIDQPTTTDAVPRLVPRLAPRFSHHHRRTTPPRSPLLHLTHSPLIAPPPTGNPKPATTTTDTPPPSLLSQRYLSLTSLPSNLHFILPRTKLGFFFSFPRFPTIRVL